MTVRVEVVTPCEEHGQWNPHRSGDGEITATSDGAEIMAVICRGASRKAFTEWPPEAIEAAAKAFNGKIRDVTTREYVQAPWEHDIEDMTAALVAAWSHITGDNK